MARPHVNDVLRAIFGSNPFKGLDDYRRTLGLTEPEFARHVRDSVGAGTYADGLPLLAVDDLMAPAGGFPTFPGSVRPLRHIVFFGDSIIQGNLGPTGTVGYSHQWTQQFITDNPGVTVHAGFQPVWRNLADYRQGAWTFVGGDNPSAAVYDLGPFSGAVFGAANVKRLATAADVATWTRPADVAVESIGVVYADHAGYSAGEVSVDGSTWQPLPQSEPADPVLVVHKVTVTDPATVRVRGVAGLYGLWPNQDASGVQVHNIGRGSATLGSTFCTIQNGAVTRKWWSLFDLIQPELTVMEVTNDTYPQSYTVALADVLARLSGYGDVVVVGGHYKRPTIAEDWTTSYKAAAQRAAAHRYGCGFIDLRGRWGSSSDALSSGYLDPSDLVHPDLAGMADIRDAINLLLDWS